MIIDAHQHFWKYQSLEFDWIGDDMKMIRHDFLPADFNAEMKAAGVDGAISVQSRQSIEETRWLLEQAGDNGFIKGVIGWLPLGSADFKIALEE